MLKFKRYTVTVSGAPVADDEYGWKVGQRLQINTLCFTEKEAYDFCNDFMTMLSATPLDFTFNVEEVTALTAGEEQANLEAQEERSG